MKKILGLDLGTNSIGWAVIEQDFEKKDGKILGVGSRILPMGQDVLGKFDAGQSVSQTADRTGYRGTRRLYQRDTLRRERLHRVLNILGFLPEHYKSEIDFDKKLGQFKEGMEPKINYKINNEAKHEFIFMSSFNEMVKEFEEAGQNISIPLDWTLYYLRKKALNHKILKEELAWIILNFNQKRGYYQLRGEDDASDDGKSKTFEVLCVNEVVKTEDVIKKTGEILYDIYFDNGWKYDKQTTRPNDWLHKTKEFIVTASTTKKGDVKRTYKAVDSERDWIAIKEKAQKDIEKYNEQNCTVGVANYIYDAILKNPTQKIRGQLIKTIERKYYIEELKTIIETQIELQPELFTNDLYETCIEELYPRNEAHKSNIRGKGFKYLFVDDIIFYQRPLKSKKSSIASCQYEYKTYKKIDEETGKIENVKEFVKAISKSHPLYQEFRLWQFLKNLKIYKRESVVDGKTELNVDVTTKLIETEDCWVELFDYLNDRKDIEQKHILEFLAKKGLITKKQTIEYRWNYIEDRKYPGNETCAQILLRLKKVEGEHDFTEEQIINLWHIIYSVKDKKQFETALTSFARKNNLDAESFVEAFKKTPPFDNDYGAYSLKTLKKILPLMRRGKYWNEDEISIEVKERISQFMERVYDITVDIDDKDFKEQLANVSDDDIPKQLIKSFVPFKGKSPLTGLNTYQACYAVYERHSEASEILKWKTPEQIDEYLRRFKQHSLRNPIVEQIITETLRTVRDIWIKYGDFDEIHVELGREMKSPKGKREQMSKQNTENENRNSRIKQILTELMDDGVKHVQPYSPSQQEALKIFEDGVYGNPDTNFNEIQEDVVEKIRKAASPTKSDIKKYILWLEQGYVSPYTGKIIPLSELFTENYQIEHIIPQSRFFDDSLSNKVICESEINPNPWKDNQTGYEFIKNMGGHEVPELSRKNGKIVKLFTLEEYESHCKRYFAKDTGKLKKLLSEDIPEGFIERQLNDTRYISKMVKNLLSNIVREERELEATSKNVVPITGAITSKLKQDWGLNDKWNEIITPRFIRLNEITDSDKYGYYTEIDGKRFFRTQVPDDVLRGFSKKRIDHRHHALDALVIASATKDHINYITSLNTERHNYGLVAKLREFKEIQKENKDTGKIKIHRVPTNYKKPWITFTTDVKEILEKTLVSFKQNLRVINRTNNKTWQWVEQKDGRFKKQLVTQKGKNFAVRKPMHKETVSGNVKIRKTKEVSFVIGLKDWQNLCDKNLKNKIKSLYLDGLDDAQVIKYFKKEPYKVDGEILKRVAVYYFVDNATASRTALTEKFTRKQLEGITDSGIRTILENHLKKHINEKGKECFDLAFCPEGIDDLNKNIVELNGGKFHHPIYKVRIYEEGNKFPIGVKGNNPSKFVEAAKGTNLFYAIYWSEEKQKRVYETIPLHEVIEHQKMEVNLPKGQRTSIPIKQVFIEKSGEECLVEYKFCLSPNDLVYVPTDEELDNINFVDFDNLSKEQVKRIYKVNDFSGVTCYFTPVTIAKAIAPKELDTSFDDKTAKFNNKPIKDTCWKLQVDRLGNIVRVEK